MDTHLKYVYIDSRMKKSTDKKNNMTIEIPQTLEHCSRFALKSFSIANTFPNMIGRSLQWIEFLQNGSEAAGFTWSAAMFEIDFSDIGEEDLYVDNATLNVKIMEKLSDPTQIKKYPIDNVGNVSYDFTSSHVVSTETPLDIVVQYNPTTYKFSIHGTQGGQKSKVMVLFDAGDGTSLWDTMGFSSHKLLKPNEIFDFKTQLTTSVQIPQTFNVEKLTDIYHVRDMKSIASNTVALRTIHAPYHSRHENHISEINVCSDLGECFLTKHNGVCIPTDIIEKIINDVPKFSYIHHKADQLYYHQLSKSKIKTFNIRLDDHNYKPIDDNVLPNWNAVIIFEQTLPVIDNHDEIMKYKEKSYEIGHPILRR